MMVKMVLEEHRKYRLSKNRFGALGLAGCQGYTGFQGDVGARGYKGYQGLPGTALAIEKNQQILKLFQGLWWKTNTNKCYTIYNILCPRNRSK